MKDIIWIIIETEKELELSIYYKLLVRYAKCSSFLWVQFYFPFIKIQIDTRGIYGGEFSITEAKNKTVNVVLIGGIAQSHFVATVSLIIRRSQGCPQVDRHTIL